MWKLYRVGKIFGVELKLHGTWLLMLAFYALSGLFQGGAPAALMSVALALVLFSVVVLHELGHIAAYRHYGMLAKDIILSPLGGVARGLGMTKNPREEFVIAAAGPAVNLVLAGLTLATLKFAPWAMLGQGAPIAMSLTNWFLGMNVALLVFNLLPALPMDGGRMLRALLTKRMGYLKATSVAAKVARWTTLAMAVYAIATANFTLLLIAGLVFLMSWAELAQAHVGAARGNPIFQAFRGGGVRGPGPTVVDQHGNTVGGQPRGGWSSAEHVRPTPDGRGWTVQSVRFLED